MKPIPIPPHEQGVTRLFALSMTPAEARRTKTDIAQQSALLGLEKLHGPGVEVFRVSDLDELGLVGYLRDGIDVQDADLARDRAKLAALDGWIMLVHSSAFAGQETVLHPRQELTLIGTYKQHNAEQIPIKIPSEAAKPYTATADVPQAKASNGRAGSSLVVLGLVGMAVFILWWALV